MYITSVPNRNSPPAILLRESYREGGKVKNRTLSNLSHLPERIIELIRKALKGDVFISARENFERVNSWHHGHGETRSFHTLLKLQSQIVRNECRPPGAPANSSTFIIITTPHAKQQNALDLLDTISL